ncbi:AbrB/MazE/SpoVT family DNA-binding domain-containing protein [Alicyclobacillus tolerans]|uniref:AbrB/MazE/SpoVT family DNA-binding domain-containing protein n=1 Tax=Alicyclobacillus tolerans TaxID=90970 RepID=UPI001F26B498|nr:AbrB/MazE/SpoVT family DNA-binding domain-containing protein [Alicyclobacillus tolerans]MCF8566485.1 AbrB/MazE/SpoVT family DNA-binding domain-containing protein [Alicyclobacillus tolerans]
MKTTGMYRKVDSLGRVVVPADWRRAFGVRFGDHVEIFVDGNDIVLQKYEVDCVLCGGTTRLFEFKGKNVCQNCKTALRQQVNRLAAELRR